MAAEKSEMSFRKKATFNSFKLQVSTVNRSLMIVGGVNLGKGTCLPSRRVWSDCGGCQQDDAFSKCVLLLVVAVP